MKKVSLPGLVPVDPSNAPLSVIHSVQLGYGWSYLHKGFSILLIC
jgi:hypothetical protein